MNKFAFISASWLVIGAAALSAPSFAADSPVKKPAASKSIAKPGAPEMKDPGMKNQDMKDHCDEHEAGMMGGHKGGMMEGQMEGMQCDHMEGMMGGHMGSMMGSHGSEMMMDSPTIDMAISLGLNDEQRSKANKLSDELKHNNWATMGMIMDESAKLRDLYAADKRDPSAIGKAYQKIFDLQRQMIEATIITENRVDELLTPEQRTQLKNMRRKGEPEHDCPMH